ncbi:5-oxoprolinase subunit PxpB [Ascidiimonas sp. W6]|uniref:5-oxoprolinase subunit PxpB n=1 Tax=Ascidiimonas meishanensis TaxID=3128903 RepID=UPI0030ED84FA
MKYPLTYKEFGEHAILIEWPSLIKEEILTHILSYQKLLKNILSTKKFEYVPSYTSLAIIDIEKQLNASEMIHLIENLDIKIDDKIELKRTLWKLPVCYEDRFASDLNYVCEEKGLSKEELINLHTGSVYTVYCMGFLPGFMYLGGLADRLHLKRRSSPRTSVPSGSVGIGGSQTGIYPQESPGGWNLIGNCPVQLFNSSHNPPCFVTVGDRIQFYSISEQEYEFLKIKVQTGIYKPENKELND